MSPYAELELAWQIRASLARQRYEESSWDFIRLVGDLKAGRSVPPDCCEALRQARLRESAALDDYLRAVRVCADLLLKGTVPKDNSQEIPDDKDPRR
jgi:hypothetical protein